MIWSRRFVRLTSAWRFADSASFPERPSASPCWLDILPGSERPDETQTHKLEPRGHFKTDQCHAGYCCVYMKRTENLLWHLTQWHLSASPHPSLPGVPILLILSENQNLQYATQKILGKSLGTPLLKVCILYLFSPLCHEGCLFLFLPYLL